MIHRISVFCLMLIIIVMMLANFALGAPIRTEVVPLEELTSGILTKEEVLVGVETVIENVIHYSQTHMESPWQQAVNSLYSQFTEVGDPKLVFDETKPMAYYVPLLVNNNISGLMVIDPYDGQVLKYPDWNKGGGPRIKQPYDNWKNLERIAAKAAGLDVEKFAKEVRILKIQDSEFTQKFYVFLAEESIKNSGQSNKSKEVNSKTLFKNFRFTVSDIILGKSPKELAAAPKPYGEIDEKKQCQLSNKSKRQNQVADNADYWIPYYDQLPWKNQYAGVERVAYVNENYDPQEGDWNEGIALKCLAYGASTAADWWTIARGKTLPGDFTDLVCGELEQGFNPRELELKYIRLCDWWDPSGFDLVNFWYRDPVTGDRVPKLIEGYAKLLTHQETYALADYNEPLFGVHLDAYTYNSPADQDYGVGNSYTILPKDPNVNDIATYKNALRHHGVLYGWTDCKFGAPDWFEKIAGMGHSMAAVGYMQHNDETLLIFHDNYGSDGGIENGYTTKKFNGGGGEGIFWAYYFDGNLTISKGLSWLKAQQSANGSWSNEPAVTSLAVLAMLNWGYDENDPVVHAGLDYLLNTIKVNDNGSFHNESGRYTYYTSIAILPLIATRNDDYKDEIQKMRNWLIGSQWDEDSFYASIDTTNINYGGFGYGNGSRADLSNTQWALMGIKAADEYLGVNANDTDQTYDKAAQYFLERCQNADGGSYYTPNGGSIHSMTAASVWSYLLCGVGPGEVPVADGLQWLAENYSLISNDGWGRTSDYYYALTFAKALTMSHKTKLGDIGGHDWFEELSEQLMNWQTEDGNWPGGGWLSGQADLELTTCYSILSLQTRTLTPHADLSMSIILESHADVHVYDPHGRHMGVNYDTMTIEENIPGATFKILDADGNEVPYDGTTPDEGLRQVITLPVDAAGSYRVELVGTSDGPFDLTINGQQDSKIVTTRTYDGEIHSGENLATTVTVTAMEGAMTLLYEPLDVLPIMEATPNKVQLIVEPDTAQDFTFTVSEVGGQETLHSVSIYCTDITGPASQIHGSNVEFDINNFDVPAGKDQIVNASIPIPADFKGSCTGSIIIESADGGTKSIALTIEKPFISLIQGWNLISLCKEPPDNVIPIPVDPIIGKYSSVWAFQNKSWKVYDPDHPGFSDLTTMDAGWGYWINMTEAAELTVTGTEPSSKSINLIRGWNLVGYNSCTPQPIADALKSIEGKYISVWLYINGQWKVYDPANPGFSDLDTMEPGYGYWIKAKQNCTWTLP